MISIGDTVRARRRGHRWESCEVVGIEAIGGLVVVRFEDGKVRRCTPEALKPPPQQTSVGRLSSPPDTRPVKLRAVPKAAPPSRNPAYLEHVRSQRCCSCGLGEGVEAHHWGPGGGMSQKCSDYHTVPLCVRCHRHWHDKAALPHHDRDESERIMATAKADLAIAWIEGQGKDN